MATNPNADASVSTTFNYPSVDTIIYSVAPGATKTDIGEFLAMRLAHLKALLAMTNGDAERGNGFILSTGIDQAPDLARRDLGGVK